MVSEREVRLLSAKYKVKQRIVSSGDLLVHVAENLNPPPVSS